VLGNSGMSATERHARKHAMPAFARWPKLRQRIDPALAILAKHHSAIASLKRLLNCCNEVVFGIQLEEEIRDDKRDHPNHHFVAGHDSSLGTLLERPLFEPDIAA
jgi:hypothetical protein